MNVSTVRRIGLPAARGAALFLSLFSLANTLGSLVGRGTEDLWWIDLSALPPAVSFALSTLCALLAGWWAVVPAAPRWRRLATALAFGTLAAAAAFNVGAFYAAWRGGRIAPGVPVPFSALLALVLAGLALVAGWVPPGHDGVRKGVRQGVIGWALVFALLFPLAHVVFFGTTDYRRPADAVVVFGAKVHESGVLSSSLRDRVETAIELHRAGLAPLIVMSGGVDVSRTDEAAAMAEYAVARGVAPSALLLDSSGMDTDATVAGTLRLVGPGARLLAVSQFYHLPRIKMAFRLAGQDVSTVPARELQPIPRTPYFVLREVPAFWLYWARGLLGR